MARLQEALTAAGLSLVAKAILIAAGDDHCRCVAYLRPRNVPYLRMSMLIRSQLRPRLAAACAAALLLLAHAPARAGDGLPDAAPRGLQEGVFWDPNFDPKVEFGVSAGQMNVTGREFIYDGPGGNKVSQLDYISNELGIISAKVGVRVTPWVRLDFLGTTALSGESESDDYDWIQPPSFDFDDWTHHSHSDDTDIDGIHQLDASTRVELFRHPNFEIGVLGGVRWDHFAWSVKGGDYVYSSMDPATGARIGFRDDIGSFKAEQLGLSFEQDYITPYLGVGINAHLGKLTLEGNVKGSLWATVDAVDKHYLRAFRGFQGFTSRTQVDGGEMSSFNVGASYAITDSLSISGNFERQVFGEQRGSQRRSCLDVNGDAAGANPVNVGGKPVTCPIYDFGADSQAVDNSSQKYLIGLTYKLN
jgi:outer membrane protease